MSELHITWTLVSQPATRWRLDMPGEHWIEWSPFKRIRCHDCRRVRLARSMRVIEQAYYDPHFFCATCPPKKRKKPNGRGPGRRKQGA